MQPAQADGSAPHESATSTHRSTSGDLDLIGAVERPEVHSGRSDAPSLWIPAPIDAPSPEYVRESFAGMGDELVDQPDAPRVEGAMLRLPSWEAEYLKQIDRFDHPRGPSSSPRALTAGPP